VNARACAQVMTLTRSGMTLGSDGRDIVRIYRLGSEIAKVVNAVLRAQPLRRRDPASESGHGRAADPRSNPGVGLSVTQRRLVRVGVYVDAYNLYYGGRALCGRAAAGWRWLDVRGLALNAIATQGSWSVSNLEHVVYCTARVDAVTNPGGHRDQDVISRRY
jgi:hypothetical protein